MNYSKYFDDAIIKYISSRSWSIGHCKEDFDAVAKIIKKNNIDAENITKFKNAATVAILNGSFPQFIRTFRNLLEGDIHPKQ
jgi:hypothetical protein